MRKKVTVTICLFMIASLLYGCFKGEQTSKEMDIPEEISYVDEADMDEEEDIETEEVVETEETAERVLYLIDASGLVVPQTVELPKKEGAALQVLEYLVKDGPVTELLPNGFQAVLPAGTDIIGVNLIEDGTLIVDVSEEFSDYQADEELQILQAMTHTLTQFNEVDRIKIWINGEEIDEMPVNGTPISEGYSRYHGINIYVKDEPNVVENNAFTVYYPKNYDEDVFYVPVTQYAETKDDLYSTIFTALMDGPEYQFKTKQVFNDETALVEATLSQNGVLQLIFNDEVLLDRSSATIADEVVETIVRTYTALDDVEAIDIQVENGATIVNEAGEPYEEPVTLESLTSSIKM